MRGRRFSYFVVLAGMRTGSNLLERSLNAVEGVACHGELFNPVFVGHPKHDERFGLTQAERDDAPLDLLAAMLREDVGFSGYRHFDGHDARVLSHVLADPACAKIVLTRNPVDSYVSLKLARASGQWLMTAHRNKSADTRIDFDPAEYAEFTADREAFLGHIRRALQTTGQTSFEIDYEELLDAEVLNGLLKFLGCAQHSHSPDKSLKKQNTSELSDRVRNFDELQRAVSEDALSALDAPRRADTPRGPAVRSFIAAPRTGLVYIPVPGGPTEAVETWLTTLERDAGSELRRAMTQKQFRELRAANLKLRSFAVLRHPLLRAFSSFLKDTSPDTEGYRPEIFDLLHRRFGLRDAGRGDPAENRHDSFRAYIRFLKATLAGQSGVGVAPAWRTQLSALQGVGRVTLPDLILREGQTASGVNLLIGSGNRPEFPASGLGLGRGLDEIYDRQIEKAARGVYGRDYAAFGFPDWSQMY